MSEMLRRFSSKNDECTDELLSSSGTDAGCSSPFIYITMETINENTDKNSVSSTSERNSELSSDTKSDIHLQELFFQTNHSDDPNRLRPKSLSELGSDRAVLQTGGKFRRTLSRLHIHKDDGGRRHHWSAAANRIGRLNTKLLDAIELHNNVEVESMLNAGANPNATCRAGHISACHAAAFVNCDALHLLLEHSADRNRKDKFGRTPLHLAAWAGKNWTIALLLNFPPELQYEVALDVTPQAEEHIKKWRHGVPSVINVPCELPLISIVPQNWKDNIEHRCRRYMTLLPKFSSGMTPLHIASCAAHHNTVRLLLAAGANPNSKEALGQTPLDIAGSGYYVDAFEVNVENYVKTIEALILYGGKLNTMEAGPSYSALHIAVQLCSVEAIQALLVAGAPITHLNERGNTPLHECVEKFYKEPLEVLAKHCRRGQKHHIDVTNSSGYTVLHTAILASWIPGVCVALDAGADVHLEDSNGHTAIHIAARKGELDILEEILRNAEQDEHFDVNYDNGHTEPPVFCAIRSGCLDSVQTFIYAGATLKLTFYNEPNLGETTMEAYLLTISEEEFSQLNMILHATAEAGSVDMLELLLEHDKSLETLLEYRCPYLMDMIPVEFAAFHNKFYMFKFLLEKTVERAQLKEKIFDSSMLLDIIATCDYTDLFEELVAIIPNAVRIATENGHYPLHLAAKNGNRSLITTLIHHGADLSQTNELGVTAISVVIDHISKPTEFLADIFNGYIQTNSNNIYNSGCEITVGYPVLIPFDPLKEEGQMRVLTALLKTDNRKNQRKLLAHPLVESFLYLKWKTLSTFFYMMVFLYGLFVMSLSVYIVSVFFYKDTKPHDFPYYWSPHIWQYIIYLTLAVIVIQELSCTNLAINTWVFRELPVEYMVKFGTYSLALVTPQISTIESPNSEWRRHLASLTLVLAWLNIMMLLSKTPMSGYYIQMFWKVSKKILKILLSFLFLVLMFSFCFMVEFHSEEPFEGPWAAIVKTLVMMTSEFDYSDTFTTEKNTYITDSIQMLRVIFVIFLILAAIVLMNLMIGVAVHDVQYLVLDGNLRRLEQQVEFLNKLEISRGKKSFFHMLRLYKWFNRKEVPQTVKFKPVHESECCFTGHIKEAILRSAEELTQIREEDPDKTNSKFNNILEVIKESEQNIMSQITELQAAVIQIRKSINQHSDILNPPTGAVGTDDNTK